MAKTHTKINQLAGETLKGFAYANNSDLELVDDVQAVRDPITHHTEIIRDYDSVTNNLAFTGTGVNNLNIVSINVQTPTTITIDSQDVFSGTLFNGVGLNDASVNYTAYSGNRPITFTFGIDAANDETSTGSGGFTGTPISGEIFYDGLGNSFKFISYDSGTDTIYAYSIIGNVVGTYTGVNSGSTVTLVNTFTAGPNEVGAWSDSLGNNGVWSIQPTVAYTIGVPTNTLDVTFAGAGHNVTDFWGVLFAKGSIVYDVQSQSGALTVGETLNGSLGSTAVFGYQFGSGQVAITQITGSPALGNGSETFTGSVSGNTINLANPITYTDTYSATDGVTTTQFNIVQSENTVNIFGNTFDWGSEIGHNTGDFWALTFPLVNIETGYETQGIVFPNVPFPLEGSSIYSEDTDGKVAIGTFDLSPFGGESKTVGILSLYADGSQASYTQEKSGAILNIFDNTANKSIGINYNGDKFRINGFDGSNGYNLLIDPTRFRYTINGQEQRFPTVFGSSMQILYTDGSGQMYWDNTPPPTITNGITQIGPDIGLGGALTQDTDINVFDGGNTSYFRVFGNDTATNQTGICYYPLGFNNLTGYAGAYSNISGYNKVGVYSTGLNEHLAVLGFYDGSLTIPNASYTIHEHNMNTAYASKETKLVNDNSNLSTYSDFIENTGANIVRVEQFTNTNPFSAANGRSITETTNLDTSTEMRSTQFFDSISNRQINEVYDVNLLLEKRITVADNSNSHTFKQTTTDLKSTAYPSTRDDSAITNPTNFIYTDATGEFKSAPLGKGIYILPAYADDAAAGLGGVVAGELYQTDGTGAAPLTVAGIVMIKQ